MPDGLRIEVKGADTLRSTLGAAARDLNSMTATNQRAGEVLARTVQARAPRRTGRLASSVSVRADDRGVEVGTPIAYGRFQDLGTRFVRPTYYLSGALAQAEGTVVDVYEVAVDRAVGKVRGA
jgi:Bacteriophage HK97-gp10, putative tail-component